MMSGALEEHMAKNSKLKAAAVKIGSAVGRAEGKAIAAKKAAAEAADRLKKKAKAVGKELKESKKHLVRAYEKAKS